MLDDKISPPQDVKIDSQNKSPPNVHIDPKKLKFKTCTFNTYRQFRTLAQIHEHTSFFHSKPQKFDIICLQETGLLKTPSEIPDEFLENYTLYTNFNKTTYSTNHSTAVLISSRLSRFFVDSYSHPSGRLLAVIFQWEAITLCVVCVYFPSGLQTSGLKPTTTNKKHPGKFPGCF